MLFGHEHHHETRSAVHAPADNTPLWCKLCVGAALLAVAVITGHDLLWRLW